MSDNHSILQIKSKIQSALTNQKLIVVQDLLTNLLKVKATKPLLKETGIGIFINHLKKKHLDDHTINSLTTAILTKWKNDVGLAKPKQTAGPSITASSPNMNVHPNTSVDPLKRDDEEASLTNGSAACSTHSSVYEPGSNEHSPLTSPVNQVLRSAKLDCISIPNLTHSIRSKCVEMIYNGLCLDSLEESDTILKIAIDIEEALFSKHEKVPSSGYKTDLRIYTSSLKNKELKHIRDDLFTNTLLPQEFVQLKATDLVSNKTKMELEEAKRRSIFLAQGAANIKAVTEEFRCGKCGKRKCSYFQMQTRSADEPMTTFVECLECGNNWKFC